jgi:hypothetical protein
MRQSGTVSRTISAICRILEVLLRPPDVEDLVVDRLARRLEHGEERSGDVLDVHERAPRRPVALQVDAAGRHRPGDEVVEHDVESVARRDAVRGRRPQERRAEAVVRERRDVALRAHLRLAVRRDRVERRLLVDHRVAGRAVVAARGREDEAAHAGLARGAGEARRAQVVDVEGQLGVQVAERIVRQRGEVDDGVHALEVGARDVAEVLANRRHVGTGPDVGARLEQVAVEADDVVARGAKARAP